MTALIQDLWARRELIHILVARNLKIRYKNSALGFVWTLLGPVFLILIYWVFLGILKVPIPISSLVTGILVWQFLGTCCNDSLYAILGNANLVTKTAFPRMVLPLSIVLANVVNFLLSLVVLVVFLGVVKADVGAVWWLPFIMLSQGALCLGLSLLICSLNVFFRDVEHILGVVMLAWMFLSPVVYTSSLVQDKFGSHAILHALYYANPMAGLVTAYRNVFLSQDFIQTSWLIAPFVLCWAMLALGVIVFQRLDRRFGDEL